MTDTRVALGSDRLPWLEDVPARRRMAIARDIWKWGAGAVLLVAGASYWLGVQSRDLDQDPATKAAPTGPAVTTPLPQARSLPPSADIEITSTPEVVPAPAPSVSQAPTQSVRPAPSRRTAVAINDSAHEKTTSTDRTKKSETAASAAEKESRTPAAATSAPRSPAALAPSRSLTLWPSRETAGASGRVVQIGAFGTPHQAKLGWRYMARAYPGVKRLPAVVVEARNSRGRPFYRFQIGTTSQAHSEVLCQRMEKIRFSCAVVGLPWKPKGVER
jgi:hypothetical protein